MRKWMRQATLLGTIGWTASGLAQEPLPEQKIHLSAEPAACAPAAEQPSALKIFARNYARDYLRSKHWPEPFATVDRETPARPFMLMVARGWEKQNTLGGYHFDPETGELNTAGKLKVHWIMTQAPLRFRSVWFVASEDPAVTAKRQTLIGEYASRFAPPGQAIDVRPTLVEPEGSSAAYSDRVIRLFDSSLPPPRLPESTGGEGEGG